MKNVEIRIEGQKLILTVDVSKNYGPSKTGKSTIIATSEGNVKVDNTDLYIGFNLYRKAVS